jgi:hypothetical protein
MTPGGEIIKLLYIYAGKPNTILHMCTCPYSQPRHNAARDQDATHSLLAKE